MDINFSRGKRHLVVQPDMPYLLEFSDFEYYLQDEQIKGLNIGWLDHEHSYAKGPVSGLFLERLWMHCQNPVRQTKGFHVCNFCGKEWVMQIAKRNGEILKLGSAEILVKSKYGTSYAAPDLIYHYITEHQYKPPEEFMEAVLCGPLLRSA